MRFYLAFISVFVLPVYCLDEIDEGSTLTIEHRFNSDPGHVFTSRGSILVVSFANNVITYNNDRPLSNLEFNELTNLAKHDGLYRLRIPVKTDGVDDYVETFVRACCLLVSNLHDVITLAVDNNGQILGAHLSTPVNDCNPTLVNNAIRLLSDKVGKLSFTTVIKLQQLAAGPTPDTASYIRKLDRERDEKVKAEQGDNRSFIAKYWMYLVPVFFFIVMASNQADPNAAGGR